MSEKMEAALNTIRCDKNGCHHSCLGVRAFGPQENLKTCGDILRLYCSTGAYLNLDRYSLNPFSHFLRGRGFTDIWAILPPTRDLDVSYPLPAGLRFSFASALR